MENNEMNYVEEETMEPEVESFETETEETGMATGVAMLIGAGLAFATTAIAKFGKKAITAYKAKRAAKEVDETVEDEAPEDSDE